MAYYNQDWEELGRNIQDIVDRAVKSQDYQKLNQTITQTVNKAVDLGTEAVRKAVDSASKAADPQPKVKTSVVVEKQNLPALYGSTSHKTTVGVLKTVFGGLLSCLTFVIFLSTMLVNLVSGGSLLGVSSVLTLIGFGGGVGLIASGVRNLSWVNRFKTYRKVLGQKTYCTLEKLARTEAAETFLHGLGLRDFRVRSLGDAARIQAREGDLPKLLAHREEIVSYLKERYTGVMLDLEVRP